MMDEARKLLVDTLDSCLGSNMHDWNAIKTSMKNAVSDFIFRRTGRKPMILPIIEEI
ncbi:MAG: ribonuclease J, partial [Oscillospiraceae bacterium]|nr:ribonuclease J [Oscillospiraceae bacterium]